VRDLVREQGPGAGASIFGTRESASPAFAALANGVAGHVLDYDDMNSTTLSHPSVVLVPAIFALAETLGTSGSDALSAYVLGFEISGHMGRTMVPHHYNQGWHSTSSIGIFGAAAACARLMGLDANAALNALAIAASNSAGLRGNFGTMTKSLHAGQAAEGAVRAAQLSARGFTANPGVFDARGGYFDAYGRNAEPRPAPAGLEIESSGIGIKPYACCGAGVSVIDAAVDLHAAHALSGASIEAVEVVLSPMATSIMPFHEAADGLQAKYSLAYCAAVGLLDGKGGLAQFEDERVARADVRGLVSKTVVRADARMASGAGRFGVEMKVKLAGGRTVSTSLEIPRGHPTRKLEDDLQRAKFLECAAPVIGERKASDAAAMLGDLERLPAIGELVALLRPETR
jgi:2-methylcitrate dehydratase PrpD